MNVGRKTGESLDDFILDYALPCTLRVEKEP